ncbi:hypothetical protein ILUMI_06451 [Ignelater luminosus]|uniref:Guanine nucleotide-binding protein G(s) subunit alpha n=1 Tax=Ignelater luminosus TaxID=2038154 RepID=A0A8K0DFH4_IGNLU|nr:hypothetical protein ILUMI_06451 [Ignelater luminosus]
MFCGSSTPDEDKRRSRELDKQLKNDSKKLQRIMQLLLLGTGESGKSTIIKQMQIIHINGFSEKEKQDKIPNIKQNIHESIYTLIYNMDKISPPVELKHDKSKESAEYIIKLGANELVEYPDEYYDHVKILWADPGVQETFKRSNEFQLIDSANYFLDRIDDIRKSDYIPTVQDMLFCRIMTIQISKIEFKIPYRGSDVEFWMYDVGGQRGQRKKWISAFEGIQAILFLIAASDFDQTLREDEKKNRLVESFEVFGDIFWSRFVRKAGKIVFLNKQDLLKQKIDNGHKLQDYFPDFANYVLVKNKHADPNSEYDRAKYYMREKIIHITQNKPSEIVDVMPGLHFPVNIETPPVYIHFTIATDTKNVKLVFDSVKDMILMENIAGAGLN